MTLEKLVTGTAYETFVNKPKFEALSIVNSVERSLVVPVERLLEKASVLANRVKIVGKLDPAKAREIDLTVLLPVTTELSL